MIPDLSALIIGALAFAVAFGIVKFVTVRRQKRRREEAQQVARKSQSRQVRRARDRRNGR